MDINKWKSLAINKDDHTLLVAIAKTKHRGPGPQFSKIFNDYLKFQAKREGLSLEAYKKKLLNNPHVLVNLKILDLYSVHLHTFFLYPLLP